MLLRVNPEVEFEIDASARILRVAGMDEDGERLVDGIHFTGLSFENAAIIVVNRLIEENYLSASSISERIFISAHGDAGSALELLSSALRMAASQFGFDVETIPQEEGRLELIWGGQRAEGDEPGTENQPTAIKIEYEFMKDYPTAIENAYIRFGDEERQPYYKILKAYDLVGAPLNRATMWLLQGLIENGYLTNSFAGQVVFALPKASRAMRAETLELASLMLLDAGLQFEAREKRGNVVLSPAGEFIPRELSRYTLKQVLDVTLPKERAYVTEQQRRILALAYPESAFQEGGADDVLRPRYFAVVPNFVGLSEEEALRLCALTGFVPSIVREPYDLWFQGKYTEKEIGLVIAQDTDAGGLWEVGSRFQLSILTK
ncbi:MAG: PASTA domain-containing protein [Christensenellaceae bacterium]|nr:PASTA domain-containing protein [Christensenellaceae bacterium]